jgi:hypothetical protein
MALKMSREICFAGLMLATWGGRYVMQAERLDRVIDSGHTAADQMFDGVSFWVCVAVTVVAALWVAVGKWRVDSQKRG